MYGFQVGNFLKVTLKEPAGDVEEGEFVSSDEDLVVLDVLAHTPSAHWVYIPQGNISRIIKTFPQSGVPGLFPAFKPSVGMVLSVGR